MKSLIRSRWSGKPFVRPRVADDEEVNIFTFAEIAHTRAIELFTNSALETNIPERVFEHRAKIRKSLSKILDPATDPREWIKVVHIMKTQIETLQKELYKDEDDCDNDYAELRTWCIEARALADGLEELDDHLRGSMRALCELETTATSCCQSLHLHLTQANRINKVLSRLT